MKIFNALLTLLLTISSLFAQSNLKEYKIGHTFAVSLPHYMSRTIGLYDNAAMEYKNTVKDVGGFIVCDKKEDLELSGFNFSSIDEFYEFCMRDFFVNDESRKISKSKKQSKDGVNFLECDVIVCNEEAAA